MDDLEKIKNLTRLRLAKFLIFFQIIHLQITIWAKFSNYDLASYQFPLKFIKIGFAEQIQQAQPADGVQREDRQGKENLERGGPSDWILCHSVERLCHPWNQWLKDVSGLWLRKDENAFFFFTRYEALFESSGPQPDFHRLEKFQPLQLERFLDGNSGSELSSVWETALMEAKQQWT